MADNEKALINEVKELKQEIKELRKDLSKVTNLMIIALGYDKPEKRKAELVARLKDLKELI